MNYYPYQNQFQNQNNYQYQAPPQDERIWVQGEDAAKAYLVAANGFVRLWDSVNQNIFYEKRADATGRPYMQTFRYEPINSAPNEFKSLDERITALEEVIKNEQKSNTDDK